MCVLCRTRTTAFQKVPGRPPGADSIKYGWTPAGCQHHKSHGLRLSLWRDVVSSFPSLLWDALRLQRSPASSDSCACGSPGLRLEPERERAEDRRVCRARGTATGPLPSFSVEVPVLDSIVRSRRGRVSPRAALDPVITAAPLSPVYYGLRDLCNRAMTWTSSSPACFT